MCIEVVQGDSESLQAKYGSTVEWKPPSVAYSEFSLGRRRSYSYGEHDPSNRETSSIGSPMRESSRSIQKGLYQPKSPNKFGVRP